MSTKRAPSFAALAVARLAKRNETSAENLAEDERLRAKGYFVMRVFDLVILIPPDDEEAAQPGGAATSGNPGAP